MQVSASTVTMPVSSHLHGSTRGTHLHARGILAMLAGHRIVLERTIRILTVRRIETLSTVSDDPIPPITSRKIIRRPTGCHTRLAPHASLQINSHSVSHDVLLLNFFISHRQSNQLSCSKRGHEAMLEEIAVMPLDEIPLFPTVIDHQHAFAASVADNRFKGTTCPRSL